MNRRTFLTAAAGVAMAPMVPMVPSVMLHEPCGDVVYWQFFEHEEFGKCARVCDRSVAHGSFILPAV